MFNYVILQIDLYQFIEKGTRKRVIAQMYRKANYEYMKSYNEDK